MGCDQEMEVSPELSPDAATYIESIFGILKWIVIDTITKLSSLSSHLEASVHIMAYVGQKYSSRLAYDPMYPDMDHNVFK